MPIQSSESRFVDALEVAISELVRLRDNGFPQVAADRPPSGQHVDLVERVNACHQDIALIAANLACDIADIADLVPMRARSPVERDLIITELAQLIAETLVDALYVDPTIVRDALPRPSPKT